MELQAGNLIRAYFEESGGWTYGFVERVVGDSVFVYWFDWEHTTEEDIESVDKV